MHYNISVKALTRTESQIPPAWLEGAADQVEEKTIYPNDKLIIGRVSQIIARLGQRRGPTSVVVVSLHI